MDDFEISTQRIKSQDPVSHLVLEIKLKRLHVSRRRIEKPASLGEESIHESGESPAQAEEQPALPEPATPRFHARDRTQLQVDATGKLRRLGEAQPILDHFEVTQQVYWQSKVLSLHEVSTLPVGLGHWVHEVKSSCRLQPLGTHHESAACTFQPLARTPFGCMHQALAGSKRHPESYLTACLAGLQVDQIRGQLAGGSNENSNHANVSIPWAEGAPQAPLAPRQSPSLSKNAADAHPANSRCASLIVRITDMYICTTPRPHMVHLATADIMAFAQYQPACKPRRVRSTVHVHNRV